MDVAIVDDHPIVYAGVDRAVSEAGMCLVWQGSDPVALLTAIRGNRVAPTVVLLDLNLAGCAPDPDLVRGLAEHTTVVIFSGHANPPQIRALVAAGAVGFVEKAAPPVALAEAIRTAAAGDPLITDRVAGALVFPDPGGPRLSPRARRALGLHAAGLSAGDAARRMNVTCATYRTYIRDVIAEYRAAGMPADRADLHRYAQEAGLVPHHAPAPIPRAG